MKLRDVNIGHGMNQKEWRSMVWPAADGPLFLHGFGLHGLSTSCAAACAVKAAATLITANTYSDARRPCTYARACRAAPLVFLKKGFRNEDGHIFAIKVGLTAFPNDAVRVILVPGLEHGSNSRINT